MGRPSVTVLVEMWARYCPSFMRGKYAKLCRNNMHRIERRCQRPMLPAATCSNIRSRATFYMFHNQSFDALTLVQTVPEQPFAVRNRGTMVQRLPRCRTTQISAPKRPIASLDSNERISFHRESVDYSSWQGWHESTNTRHVNASLFKRNPPV